MFWGLVVEVGSRYIQSPAQAFNISMAVLEPNEDPLVEEEHPVSVFAEYKNIKYLLCLLSKKKKIFQVQLGVRFEKGAKVVFYAKGGNNQNRIHLTGYLIVDPRNLDLTFNDMQSSIMPTPTTAPAQKSILVNSSSEKRQGPKKRVSINAGFKEEEESEEDEDSEIDFLTNQLKMKKGSSFGLEDLDEEEDSDDEGFNLEEEDEIDDDDDDDEDLDEEEDDDDEVYEENDDFEEIDQAAFMESLKKTLKNREMEANKMKKEKNKAANTVNNKDSSPKEAQFNDDGSPKNEKKIKLEMAKKEGSPKEQQSKAESSPKNAKNNLNKTPEMKNPKAGKNIMNNSGMKTPEQNSQSPDTPSSVGNTPKKSIVSGGVIVQEIKIGNGTKVKKGSMVNVGYIGRLKTNNKVFDQSKSFKFRVGKGEVIKGWDVGLEGMCVGGKRKLIIPPHMAYARRGAPPDIPPNAHLIFEVTLNSIS